MSKDHLRPKYPTAAQQSVAPDRLQLRSFLTLLPAPGELVLRAVNQKTREIRGFSGFRASILAPLPGEMPSSSGG